MFFSFYMEEVEWSICPVLLTHAPFFPWNVFSRLPFPLSSRPVILVVIEKVIGARLEIIGHLF